MEAWDEEVAPPSARRRAGVALGVMGLALLFGSALSFPFVPEIWQLPVLGLIAVGAGTLVAAYFLVR